jgi:protein ImuB
VNDAAARLGLTIGMALADAKAMYPALTVMDAEPEAEQRLLAAVADWCDRYTPLIGLDPPEGLMLDITGCAHLFGGEAALGRDIVRRLAQQGLAARAAVADTTGCAWAAARYGEAASLNPPLQGEGRHQGMTPTRLAARADLPLAGGGKEAPCLIVPSGNTREALLPLPLAALRILPDIQNALAQVGLKRIADVIDRPRAPLAARFGEDFIRRLDQALGRADTPITPRLPVPACVAERRFAEPILLEADVLGTIEGLARELGRILERRGEGARRLQVALFRTDGRVERAEVGTGAPLRDPARIRALFVERIAAAGDMADPGFGFDVIRLAALATERCEPTQTGLAAADHAGDLAHLIDRLGARFGLRRITRLVPQDTHIPEFAIAAVPAAEDRRRRTDDGERKKKDHLSSVVCRPSSDSRAPPRPLRLLTRPEPIEAIAEVPDGPPVRFRWRHVLHQVAHAEGPERIAMEWWRDQKGRALTRDYFRIESEAGMRVWLYREGLYGEERVALRWFLHGLFA